MTMKKVLLYGTAFFLSLGFSKAQGWATTNAHDDFAGASVYKNGTNLEGLVWWADNVFTISRLGDGKMTVAAVSAGGAGNYPLIGVNFNDANDNGTGTPFVVDLSGGMADITIDIENTSSQLLFMDIKLEDINNVQSGIEPNISDVISTAWVTAGTDRKGLNGFTLAAGQRKTITIDLSSVPANLGGLTTGAYSCAGPADCPVTTHSIDPSKIKTVIFRVNFGSDNIDLTEGDGDPTADTFISGASIVAFTGNIVFHDFKIGDVPASITDAEVNNSLKIYPNPTKETLNVSFDAVVGAEVSLSDITGFKVYSTTASAGSNTITVNTSALSSGLYILNVGTENGSVARKVTVE